MPTGNKITWKGTKSRTAVQDNRPPGADVLTVDDPLPGLILGKRAGSSYEWYISLALDKYNWKYMYQVVVNHGSRMAGGQILDFLVSTRPMKTALPVDGGYWHRNTDEQQMKDEELLQALRRKGYQVSSDIKRAFDKDAATLLDAERFILKTFGRN